MNWYNFKQTIRKHMGLCFNYKEDAKLYYHTEWTMYNLDEINKKLSRLKSKLEERRKEFDKAP